MESAMSETLHNEYVTYLSGALTSGATTVNVAVGGAPTPNFRIRVDDELMLVTSVGSGTDWTVTRGIEGSTATTHASGATVAHVVTYGGLVQYLTENFQPLAAKLTALAAYFGLAGPTAARTYTFPDADVSVGTQEVLQQSKSANYTCVLSDSGKHIYHPATDDNARTFTIPSNASVAYPVGTALTFINDKNTLTIAIDTDTMVLAGGTTTGSRTLATTGMATAVKVTSTRWVISGSNLT